jgi:hypothetical protein
VHGDRLAHSSACRRHLVTADCPVDCLAPLLSSRVLGRLARADGRHGAAVASCGTPATVSDVVRLYRQGQLGEIGGLGPLSIREIGMALMSRGLVAAEDSGAITPHCPVECLRSVISGRVLNRLARADGRGVPVAPGGPPATVGDVIRRYRGGRLGEIAGLGPRGVSEIEAGLVFAGLDLDGGAPVRQQPLSRATAPALTAGRAGTRQRSIAPCCPTASDPPDPTQPRGTA